MLWAGLISVQTLHGQSHIWQFFSGFGSSTYPKQPCAIIHKSLEVNTTEYHTFEPHNKPPPLNSSSCTRFLIPLLSNLEISDCNPRKHIPSPTDTASSFNHNKTASPAQLQLWVLLRRSKMFSVPKGMFRIYKKSHFIPFALLSPDKKTLTASGATNSSATPPSSSAIPAGRCTAGSFAARATTLWRRSRASSR